MTPRKPIAIAEGDADICKLIWLSVLYQLMTDIVGPSKQEALEAMAWLKSSNFTTVCLLANIQPHVGRRMFDKVMQEGKVPEGFNIQTLKEAVFGKKVERVGSRLRKIQRTQQQYMA